MWDGGYLQRHIHSTEPDGIYGVCAELCVGERRGRLQESQRRNEAERSNKGEWGSQGRRHEDEVKVPPCCAISERVAQIANGAAWPAGLVQQSVDTSAAIITSMSVNLSPNHSTLLAFHACA